MTRFALLRWLAVPAKGELTLAAVLTFVLALNNFAVPAILQTKVLPDEMWVQFNTKFDTMAALRLSVPPVIAPCCYSHGRRAELGSRPGFRHCVQLGIFRRQLGSVANRLRHPDDVTVRRVRRLPLGQIVFAQRTWAELPGAIEASTSPIWNSFWFAAATATVVVEWALVFVPQSPREGERLHVKIRYPAAMIGWRRFHSGVLTALRLIKIFNRPVLAAFYQSVGIVCCWRWRSVICADMDRSARAVAVWIRI